MLTSVINLYVIPYSWFIPNGLPQEHIDRYVRINFYDVSNHLYVLYYNLYH